MVNSKFLLLRVSTINGQIIDGWRSATSNDPWGPTGTEMSEIAHMTFETLVTIGVFRTRLLFPELI